MPKRFFAPLALFALLTLAGQGCPTPAPEHETSMQPAAPPAMEAHRDSMATSTAMAEHSSYQPFTKAAYEEAKSSGKPILLFFYANWCPYCKEQDPRFTRVIPTHEGGVIAFRVNYKDTDTDADEAALANQFGVTTQHTMFFIGRDGQTKKKVIGTISDAQTLEYLDLISS